MRNEEKAVVAIHPSIFIQLQEHWFMFLMESHNPSLRANGRNTQKMSTGLKELTGFMEEMQILLL